MCADVILLLELFFQIIELFGRKTVSPKDVAELCRCRHMLLDGYGSLVSATSGDGCVCHVVKLAKVEPISSCKRALIFNLSIGFRMEEVTW